MLKINRNEKSFSLLEKPSLAAAAITERYDLQEFISNSPDEFFQELDIFRNIIQNFEFFFNVYQSSWSPAHLKVPRVGL